MSSLRVASDTRLRVADDIGLRVASDIGLRVVVRETTYVREGMTPANIPLHAGRPSKPDGT